MVELESPKPIAQNELADAFAKLLGKNVRTDIVPREFWESLFRFHQQRRSPDADARRLHEGWAEFDGGEASSKKE